MYQEKEKKNDGFQETEQEEGRKRMVEGIKMYYIYIPISHKKCNDYILQINQMIWKKIVSLRSVATTKGLRYLNNKTFYFYYTSSISNIYEIFVVSWTKSVWSIFVVY